MTLLEKSASAGTRVVHLIKATGLAGAERHCLTLLAGLRAHGIDARLLVLTEPGRPVEELFAAARSRGIPAVRCLVFGDADPTLWLRIAGRLRRMRPDLLHTHLVHADLHGAVAARAAGVRRLVSTRHNDDAFRRRAPWRWVHRRLWARLDGAIAVSESVAKFSREIEGAPKSKVVTVHHGLDLPDHRSEREAARSELGVEPDAILIGMVGRLTHQKGFDLGLEAAGRLARELPAVRILVMGDGPLRDDLRRRIAALGLGERAQSLGWRPDAARLMAALDILLVPSRWEGFGLVLLEAMTQEALVVATPVGAVGEIVTDGVTGWIAASASADALLERLRMAAADRERRLRMARSGREHVLAAFSPERMVEQTIAFYERLGVASVEPLREEHSAARQNRIP